jgi:hypothetical protein
MCNYLPLGARTPHNWQAYCTHHGPLCTIHIKSVPIPTVLHTLCGMQENTFCFQTQYLLVELRSHEAGRHLNRDILSCSQKMKDATRPALCTHHGQPRYMHMYILSCRQNMKDDDLSTSTSRCVRLLGGSALFIPILVSFPDGCKAKREKWYPFTFFPFPMHFSSARTPPARP